MEEIDLVTPTPHMDPLHYFKPYISNMVQCLSMQLKQIFTMTEYIETKWIYNK